MVDQQQPLGSRLGLALVVGTGAIPPGGRGVDAAGTGPGTHGGSRKQTGESSRQVSGWASEGQKAE